MRHIKRYCILAVLAATTSCATSGGEMVAAPVSPVSSPSSFSTVTQLPPEKSQTSKVVANPLDDPRADHRILYSYGLSSDPITGSIVPAVTADDAIKTAAETQNFGDDVQPGAPITVLRMVTVGGPDEEPAPMPHPAWVLTWQHSCAAVRGTFSAAEAEAIASKTNCVFVVVIDAASGRTEDVRQSCRG